TAGGRVSVMVGLLYQHQAQGHAAADGEQAGQGMAGQLAAADADHQPDLEDQVGEQRQRDGNDRLAAGDFFQVEQTQRGQHAGVGIGQAGGEGDDVEALVAGDVLQPGRGEQDD